MPIVNFAVPQTLDQRVKEVMKEKGFGSKAEFFRFAAIHFIDIIQKPSMNEDARFAYLSKEVTKEVMQQYRGKNLPPVREQLKDL